MTKRASAADGGYPKTLRIEADPGARWDRYEFSIDGPVSPKSGINPGDSITSQADGTTLISGGVKDGRVEEYDIGGPVRSWSMDVQGAATVDGVPVGESGSPDGEDGQSGDDGDRSNGDGERPDGEEGGEEGGDTPSGSGTALVRSSLDTMADINDFFDETANRAKVDTVSSSKAGSGAMRINQPSKQRSEEEYGGNEFYGTEGFHWLDRRSEYPDAGLEECHIRFWAKLDEGYTIDNPWAGQQMGKGFPGFEAEWNGNVSHTKDAWEALGAVWSADKIGGSKDDWCLSYYVYDQNTPTGDNGRTYHPSKAMQKGQWYQIDRFVSVPDNRIVQWQDGEKVIDLDGGQIQIAGARSPYDRVQAVRNLFYYGGGWGAPDGSGDNFAYLDDIQVFDAEQRP